MKVVTMCQGGHVRSVALKHVLRYSHGHDVIACGWEANSRATLAMLFAWADVIVVLQREFSEFVPPEFHDKDGRRRLYAYDVGPDRFGSPFHPELQNLLRNMVTSHGLLA